MITRVRRAMSLDEVVHLERLERDSWMRRASLLLVFLISVVCLGGSVAAALANLALWLAPAQEQRFWGTGIFLGFAWALFLWSRSRRAGDEVTISAERQEGEVELMHVHAFAAARAGNAFFFDVGEGQLLCCRGNHLHALARAGTFPNRYFTLVRLPLSKRTLRVECHGEPLQASVVADATIADVPDGAIFSARLDHLREDLAALVAAGWKST